jgi:hypothetical protein
VGSPRLSTCTLLPRKESHAISTAKPLRGVHFAGLRPPCCRLPRGAGHGARRGRERALPSVPERWMPAPGGRLKIVPSQARALSRTGCEPGARAGRPHLACCRARPVDVAAERHHGRRPEKAIIPIPVPVPFQVGKYLVSPLTRRAVCGRYAASVSIRSGRGSMTHDRVLRLLPLFDSSEEAAHHAKAEGLAWIESAGFPAQVDSGPSPAAVSALAPTLPPAARRRPMPWPRKN